MNFNTNIVWNEFVDFPNRIIDKCDPQITYDERDSAEMFDSLFDDDDFYAVVNDAIFGEPDLVVDEILSQRHIKEVPKSEIDLGEL